MSKIANRPPKTAMEPMAMLGKSQTGFFLFFFLPVRAASDFAVAAFGSAALVWAFGIAVCSIGFAGCVSSCTDCWFGMFGCLGVVGFCASFGVAVTAGWLVETNGFAAGIAGVAGFFGSEGLADSAGFVVGATNSS